MHKAPDENYAFPSSLGQYCWDKEKDTLHSRDSFQHHAEYCLIIQHFRNASWVVTMQCVFDLLFSNLAVWTGIQIISFKRIINEIGDTVLKGFEVYGDLDDALLCAGTILRQTQTANFVPTRQLGSALPSRRSCKEDQESAKQWCTHWGVWGEILVVDHDMPQVDWVYSNFHATKSRLCHHLHEKEGEQLSSPGFDTHSLFGYFISYDDLMSSWSKWCNI